jgi:solute carrier family 13 (sodium-dependent dicarboxylate transporter), member 2/3/5
MLPVSTPCNAMVYGSGYIPLGRMIRWGFALDLAGMAVIVLIVRLLSPAALRHTQSSSGYLPAHSG